MNSIVEQQRISAQDLVDKLIDQGVSAKNINDFDDITSHLLTTARDGDLIVIMGAGPVTSIAHSLIDQAKVTQ